MITKDEIKNGWDAKSLEKYQKEREKVNLETISKEKVVKPESQERYRPLHWRD